MKPLNTTLIIVILSGSALACLTLAMLYQATGQEKSGSARIGNIVSKKRVPSNPVEVGDVAWERDVDAALLASRKSKNPVFALFQEVPG